MKICRHKEFTGTHDRKSHPEAVFGKRCICPENNQSEKVSLIDNLIAGSRRTRGALDALVVHL